MTPFIRDLMTKLTTDLCAQRECQNEEAEVRPILSSLHAELSIFIHTDLFVFDTLSRNLVYNIAGDAKDTTLKFGTLWNVQDISDAVFLLQSWRGSRFLHEREDHDACPPASLCRVWEERLQEVWPHVETLVFQQKDLWITLWMECMDDSDKRETASAVAQQQKVIREQST